MSNLLSKDQILSAHDIHVEELPVPEWGGVICIKTLSADERDQIESEIIQINPQTGQPKAMKTNTLRSLVAFYGICDEEGHRLFTDKRDIDLLGRKSAAALDRVVVRIQELSAMSPADIEKLVTDLKNDQPAALPIA